VFIAVPVFVEADVHYYCKFCFFQEYKYLNVITEHPRGARGSVVVKALCYKPEGRGFDS
jgi:hypothetical protein